MHHSVDIDPHHASRDRGGRHAGIGKGVWWWAAAMVAVALVAVPLGPIAQPAQAGFPGVNGRIAFESTRDGNSEIYVVDADGGDPERLTDHQAPDVEPAWSPDGFRIAFVSARDGNREIYAMDADGGALGRLTDNDAVESDPAWSPDGSRIAFTSTRDGSAAEIYVMAADGSDARRLTDDDAIESDPAWSPDGSRIAFTSTRDGGFEVYVMDADGTDVQRLTDSDRFNGEPTWSPDGSRIAFSSTRDGNSDLYVMDADGSDVRRLTDDDAGDFEPAWSPDGSYVAFTSDRIWSQGVYVVAVDGSGLRRLSGGDGGERRPDWQPRAPVAVADEYSSVPRSESFVSPVGVLDNDVTADTPTVEVVAGPAHGAVELAADGTFTYTLADPFTDQTGDGFTYRACAAAGCGDPAPVTLVFEQAPVEVATSLTAEQASYGFLLRSVTVHARLTVADNGAPLAGQRVVFSTGPRQLCVAHTDSAGDATCTAGLGGALAALLRGRYQASFAGDDPYLATTASAPA